MKRTDPQRLSAIIDTALRASNLEDAALEHRASFLWAEVMGPGITRYTARRWVRGGVLHAEITSAPLKNELSFHKQRIIDAINTAVGRDIIKSIKFL